MILRCLFILFFISFFHDSFAQNKFDIANVKQLGGEIYNLYGIKVKSPHKGLFISNSNKIIVR